MATAAILLYNDKKQVLLQHRSETARRMPGYWAFFGGGIEKGETPLDAVKREALEEIGYKLVGPKKVKVQTLRDENHRPVGNMHVFMEPYNPSQTLTLLDGQGMKWVTLPCPKNMKITDHDKEVLEYIKGTY